MKKLLISGLLLAMTTSAFSAGKELVKTCSTTIPGLEDNQQVPSEISVYRNGNILSATVKQTTGGQSGSYSDVATIEEFNVRSSLSGELGQDVDQLNLGERLIVHALTLTEDPIFENKFSAGLDLRKVRNVKVYTIGKPTNMGLSAIVEARDEYGNELGSFFGGFLVSPCK